LRPDKVVRVEDTGDGGGCNSRHGPGGTVDVIVVLQSDAKRFKEGVEGRGQET